MGTPFFIFCALLLCVSSQSIGVLFTYPNPLCHGTPSNVEPSDGPACTPQPCTGNGGSSTIRKCGPAVSLAIFTPSADAGVSGWIKFEQVNTSAVQVTVNVSGITTNPDGDHGIHIHQYGDLRGFISSAGGNVTKAASVGGHFNPLGMNHSCPGSPSHNGDLGNWLSVAGGISQTKIIFGINLTGVNSIIGRAVVLHATVDDCANTLSAGARLATGVLGIANVANNVATPAFSGNPSQAVCVFHGTTVLNSIPTGSAGLAWFSEVMAPQGVHAQVRIFTNDTIERGFHVHQFGDLSVTDGSSAGPHWNPNGALHNLPTVSDTRHLGDYGSIKAFGSDGNGWYDFAPSYNPSAEMVMWNFFGRAVIIHAALDHGDDPSCAGANATGAAGARALYCVIGVPNPIDTTLPGNFLEVPSVPSNVVLNNTWSTSPCSSVPVPPPTPTPTPAPSNIIPINEPGMFPENIEWNKAAGQFITSSLGTPLIYTVSMSGSAMPQKVNTGFVSAGVHVRNGNQLFVCWGTYPATAKSQVIAYNMDTNPYTVLWTLDLDTVGTTGASRFCNDITSNNEYLFITDSAYNVIYRVTIDTDGSNAMNLQVWSDSVLYKPATVGSFALDGIVYHPNGYLVVGKLSDNSFLKVTVNEDNTAASPLLINVTGTDNQISGPDGLTLIHDDRIIVAHSIASGGGGVSALVTTDDFATVTVSSPVTTQWQAVASRMVEGTLYVLETNLAALNQGETTSQDFDIVIIKDNSDLLGDYSSSKGWIAAVVIILLVLAVLLGALIFWHFAKNRTERA